MTTETREAKLGRCKFCGSEAHHYKQRDRKDSGAGNDAVIECTNEACEASLYAPTDELAIARWNGPDTVSVPRELVEFILARWSAMDNAEELAKSQLRALLEQAR